MAFESILITGGAGFVGSSLAIRFKSLFPKVTVTALDNLHRRGSELNLPRLQEAGVRFRHGDIRCPEDLEQLADFDLLIDCAAEPSVQAGRRRVAAVRLEQQPRRHDPLPGGGPRRGRPASSF